MADNKHRRVTLLVVAVFVLLLLQVALNAFNFRWLNPQTTAQIFLLTSVSVLVFLSFVAFLVLLLRDLIKILADQRGQVLGARLRTRMYVGALLLSFTPALFMFLFSFLLMNRSIDRWFSEPASEVRDTSAQVAMELSHYASLNARAEAESMADSTQLAAALQSGNMQDVRSVMREHQITLQGGFAVLYRDSAPVAVYELPQQAGPAEVHSWLNSDNRQRIPSGQALAGAILKAAQRADEPMLIAGGSEYALGSASLPGGGVIVAGLPMPSGLNAMMNGLSSGASEYWVLYRQRRTIRSMYLVMLLMLTALVLYASTWLARIVSRQITGPLGALADAMDAIGGGDYSHRVTLAASAEMGELVESFNHMAADLDESRQLADTAARELSAANLAVEARRRELETILETIPSGVVTLDAGRRILLGNRAFADLLRLEGRPQLAGVLLDSLLPAEFTDELVRLDRRAHRMGIASSEFEMRTARGAVSLSVTIAAVDPVGDQAAGSILVLEDVTELLHAQRQAAWKEVAQRIAHEIRNPLTPITLSTERIRRHIDRSTSESPGVIRKCCDAILKSVESMRTLVSQFAALAEFPVAQPRSADLNEIVESALLLFEGRIRTIRIERHLQPGLPPVMADPEALRRAFANLIDNAAEAMQESLLRILAIETSFDAAHGTAEIVVADTGPGLTDEMRERLFLPWFSTRQRGTGLGLSIVAKIVQEHGGSIRAENNVPAGARFIIELPLAETNAADGGLPATLTKAV
ncbi:MAG TPA: ATP-binding protein [Acidobacteriaceae bacterium]|nr:ATP-binding protein [Acidobacteriaceae bacterium]HTW47433.1 ATP-binding protein [Acidobacteriaceae bacterium]